MIAVACTAGQTAGGSPFEANLYVTDIAAYGDTVVVIGAGAGDGPGDLTQAGFWTSSEGGSWVQGSVTSGPASGWPEAIVGGERGFVAVGWDGCGGPWPYYDMTACETAVWTSSNGVDWERDNSGRTGSVLTSLVEWNGGLPAFTFSGRPTDWTGRIEFRGLRLVRDPAGDTGVVVPMGGPGGPERLDGWLSWSCP